MANIQGVIGGYPGFTTASTADGRDFQVGNMAIGDDGSCWVYVQASGAIDQYDICVLDETWQAAAATTTNTASAFGQWCGVAAVAFADNDYGWVQMSGVTSVNVLANAAANAALNSTATAGTLDDDGTTGAETIDGIVLTTANGGSTASAAAVLLWPKVGATLA